MRLLSPAEWTLQEKGWLISSSPIPAHLISQLNYLPPITWKCIHFLSFRRVQQSGAGWQERKRSPPKTSWNPPLEMSVELSVVLNLALTRLLQYGSCPWCWTRFKLVLGYMWSCLWCWSLNRGYCHTWGQSRYWALNGCRVLKMTGCPWCWIKKQWANAELRAGNKMYFCHTDTDTDKTTINRLK